ncbi:MAG: adenylate/guanylate cyclase domain-containing protein [Anaerolineaceae bacterium]
MAYYDYKAGGKRVKEILDNKLEVINQGKLPSVEELTFDNAYYSWVTAIFVDIRDSSSLFSVEDKVKVSKIVRGFTSECTEILRNDSNLREIGIRGDCVYAIYTTPYQKDIYECADKSFYINTYMIMLNTLLTEKLLPTIRVGIGIGTAQELVVKAGRKGVGINNPVWIGDAVTKASNLSSISNKNGKAAIAFSDVSYINIIDRLCEENKDAKSWFNSYCDVKLGTYYCGSIVKSGFDKWITDGMKD